VSSSIKFLGYQEKYWKLVDKIDDNIIGLFLYNATIGISIGIGIGISIVKGLGSLLK